MVQFVSIFNYWAGNPTLSVWKLAFFICGNEMFFLMIPSSAFSLSLFFAELLVFRYWSSLPCTLLFLHLSFFPCVYLWRKFTFWEISLYLSSFYWLSCYLNISFLFKIAPWSCFLVADSFILLRILLIDFFQEFFFLCGLFLSVAISCSFYVCLVLVSIFDLNDLKYEVIILQVWGLKGD